MSIFYEPNIVTTLSLNEEESRHCVKVLRHALGDEIEIVDGKGGYYKTLITKANEKKCEVRIVEQTHESPSKPFYIHLGIAPTKNADRMEWMVEKCTEVGIDEISFFESRYSERRVQKLDRLEKIAVSAMKQSGRFFLPKLNELVPFSVLVKSAFDGQKFIAHLEESERKNLWQTAQLHNRYFILIGPEGDFSPKEIQRAKEQGFASVSLGESRLRTETAGLVSCMMLNFLNRSPQ
ncbi:MAG: 16S rRNA (uracil(1498)-N(3))-methyltransferase [Spirosomataceae bacterium]